MLASTVSFTPALSPGSRWPLRGVALTHASLSRIPKSTLHDYEHGRIVPQLHQFKKLCEVYQLDVFEIMELLRLNFMEKRDLKSFRTTCRAEGVTPAQALNDFRWFMPTIQIKPWYYCRCLSSENRGFWGQKSPFLTQKISFFLPLYRIII